MAKLIKLTQGKFAIVDDEDFEWLNKQKWCAGINRKGGDYYALTSENRKMVGMHRKIMGVTDPKLVVDHKDHNTLNNQRSNLRVATYSQNKANRRSWPNSSSQFLGVSWYKREQKWVAKIQINGKGKSLGRYDNEIDAALAYNRGALEAYGEFANLNKV